MEKYWKEMFDLNEWFNDYYAKHEQKYRRLITLNLKCDDGTLPNDKIIALYREAETKRKRIQELEKILNV